MNILRNIRDIAVFNSRAAVRRDRDYYTLHPAAYENAVRTMNKRDVLAEEIGQLVDCYFPDKTPEVIVDAACGTGIITHELAKRGKKVIGIDCSPGALDYARKTKDPRIDFMQGNFLDLPLADGVADVYTMVMAYRFIGKEQNRFYCEVARVLKSGGIAIIPRALGDNSLYSIFHGENRVQKYAEEIGLSMESFQHRHRRWRFWVFRKEDVDVQSTEPGNYL